MRTASKHIRSLMARLDQVGVNVSIVRVDTGRYELHRNFEIVRVYKQRRSCNRFIERLSKQFSNT